MKKLKEALPQQGQVPLGGVSPGDNPIQVPGYGQVTYSQAQRRVSDLMRQMQTAAEGGQYSSMVNSLSLLSAFVQALAANEKAGK